MRGTVKHPKISSRVRNTWMVTRQKKLGVYGKSDLAAKAQFSKKTKAGQARRKVRATELKKSYVSSSGFNSGKGARRRIGLGGSETYSNHKKLARGYA